jgi:hypothetical protein
MLPAATGVYAGGIGELFQSGHLVGRQLYLLGLTPSEFIRK